MTFSKILRAILPALVIVGIIGFSSCEKKDVGDLKATITVQDTAGTKLQDIYVKVYANVGVDNQDKLAENVLGVDDTTKVTGTSGSVTFTFASEGILNVYAVDSVFIAADTIVYKGTGLIYIEEGESYSETITIRREVKTSN